MVAILVAMILGGISARARRFAAVGAVMLPRW